MTHPDIVRQERSRIVKQKAQEIGFDFCGISKAEFLEQEAPRLEQWLDRAAHGQMHYMANHFDKRLDPRKLVDGARSVISVLLNYYPEHVRSEGPEDLKISKYAYGVDYHYVLKEKMAQLVEAIEVEIGEVQGRVFVDSAPVMDKAWAAKSGLGWIGKNANLINRSMGSFFFIGEIICDLELEPDGAIRDYCGNCTRCLDACPTDAISEPYVVDGNKCISYYTIELKEAIPEDAKGKFENWIFGCDVCQDVCPWNRFSSPHQTPGFTPSIAFMELTDADFIEITSEVFSKVFKNSPIKRTKFSGLKRNIGFVRD
ncbi:epoxyqueuosine reductase [Dyadobacter jejuensis]|uniref:Epoxyqueuosine reductase n=1 Tax=Dyadobacter jejuensis TaxID=1082580 RepID=A0A316B3J8_9BACT|nr:tRNA epoxyqueuosine(34) reductase QueG [Dyadobacter jejuensis]PWJ57137.1 epoxyqueuosine reductase [Dyadobacter jejuensis]